MIDKYNQELGLLSIYPALYATAHNGDAYVDISGYEAVRIQIFSGTITDGTLATFELKESDDHSTFTAVADADLLGSESTFAAAEDNILKEFGYIGSKRYLRVDLKSYTGSPGTGGIFGAIVLRARPRHVPVTQVTA